VDELIACPEVDVVTVTVRVPHHFAIVKAALQAGKHVYCEWPLGNGLQEGIALKDLAHSCQRLGVAGTQAVVAPEIDYVRQLIDDGYVGTVLSSSLIGSGMRWGPVINARNIYLLDPANGATMLTIPVGHALAAVQHVLGPVRSVSALLSRLRTTASVVESGEQVPMLTSDQIVVMGLLNQGAPISLHYRGGSPKGIGLYWEIHGTDGDLVIEAQNGHMQMSTLTIKGARASDKAIQRLEPPAETLAPWPKEAAPRNVAIMYSRMSNDVRNGTRTAPDFEHAVRLHELIAAIEISAKTRTWTEVR
jgi:predicted dehydrogenase